MPGDTFPLSFVLCAKKDKEVSKLFSSSAKASIFADTKVSGKASLDTSSRRASVRPIP